MKYVTLLLLLPICIACTQNHRLYSDFAIHKDTLWGLDFNGHVFPVNLKNGTEILHPALNWDTTIALTCDHTGRLIRCDLYNHIKRLNRVDNTWDKLYTCSGIVTGITCDAQDNVYVITKSGIVDVNTHRIYAPDTLTIPLPWNRAPQYIIDQEDNIWLGFNIAGKRGAVYIFNTKDKTFFQPDFGDLDMEHRPIVSLFKGNSIQEVYGTSKYINGAVTTNNLIQFYRHTGKILTNTKEDVKLTTGVFYKDNIYVGNNSGAIVKWRKGAWKSIVPAKHKSIKKIYADGDRLIYLASDGEWSIKNLISFL